MLKTVFIVLVSGHRDLLQGVPNTHGMPQYSRLLTTEVCVQSQCSAYGICGVPQINTLSHHCHLTGATHTPNHSQWRVHLPMCLGSTPWKGIQGGGGSKRPCILTLDTMFMSLDSYTLRKSQRDW